VSPFLFQAEDVIPGFHVTGVQTCALPISVRADSPAPAGCAQPPGRVTLPGRRPASAALPAPASSARLLTGRRRKSWPAGTGPAALAVDSADPVAPAVRGTSGGTAAPPPDSTAPARAAGVPAHAGAVPRPSAPCGAPGHAEPASVLPDVVQAPPVYWPPRSCGQSRHHAAVFRSGSPSVPFPSRTVHAGLRVPAVLLRRLHRRRPAGC